ncbi:MAG: hypothetical protein ACTSQO_05935 [Candidatus Helarchaeota archaeon]
MSFNERSFYFFDDKMSRDRKLKTINCRSYPQKKNYPTKNDKYC